METAAAAAAAAFLPYKLETHWKIIVWSFFYINFKFFFGVDKREATEEENKI